MESGEMCCGWGGVACSRSPTLNETEDEMKDWIRIGDDWSWTWNDVTVCRDQATYGPVITQNDSDGNWGAPQPGTCENAQLHQFLPEKVGKIQ